MNKRIRSKNTVISKIEVIIDIFLLVVFLSISSLCSADDTIPARVTDLSDRKYKPALIQLLNNAKEAIVISMYRVKILS